MDKNQTVNLDDAQYLVIQMPLEDQQPLAPSFIGTNGLFGYIGFQNLLKVPFGLGNRWLSVAKCPLCMQEPDNTEKLSLCFDCNLCGVNLKLLGYTKNSFLFKKAKNGATSQGNDVVFTLYNHNTVKLVAQNTFPPDLIRLIYKNLPSSSIASAVFGLFWLMVWPFAYVVMGVAAAQNSTLLEKGIVAFLKRCTLLVRKLKNL